MYPQQRNQMHYAPPYYPVTAPQMYVGPARLPSPYEHWSLDGSQGYPYPVQCHGCCNHNCFQGHFAMRPPYNHIPPAPYYPRYSAVPGMYPAHYIPPPHYSMEVPRYEYDKDLSREHHCCGCPNHSCNRKRGTNVMIEEEEPPVEKKSSESVVPFEAKNYPYPVVWLQPSNIKSKEARKTDDSPAKLLENSKSSAQQPDFWNGWFPYDMSNMWSSNQVGGQKNNQLRPDDELKQPIMRNGPFPSDLNDPAFTKQEEEQARNQHQKDDNQQQKDDNWSNFPFPIFWMPYRPEITEKEEGDKKTSGEQESPLHIKFSPEKQSDTEKKREANITDGGPEVNDKNNVQKTIPVRQLEETEENKPFSKIGDKKPVEGSTNRKSSSPPKQSKLPPVCLRVDPLPKKSSNGGSRSPSPPAEKRNSSDSSSKKPELIRNSQENAKQDLAPTYGKSVRSKKMEEGKGNKKSIQVTTDGSCRHDGKMKLDGACGDNADHDNSVTSVEGVHTVDKAESDVGGKGLCDHVEAKVATEPKSSNVGFMAKEDNSDEAKENRKVKMSEFEAASIIQAAFRGFEVRKWESLKKLKKLAEVKEQMEQIKNRINDLEAFCDVNSYDKEKSTITEMIMSLLLKLDTVQGLHPSIRDIRKSVAKELVSLQETLDASVFKKLEAGPEQASKASCEEILPNITKEDTAIDCVKEEDNIADNRNLSNLEMSVSGDTKEIQNVLEIDALPISEDVKNREAVVANENLVNKLTEESSTESLNGTSETTMETNNEGDDKECDINRSLMKETSHEYEGVESKQTEAQELGEELSPFDDTNALQQVVLDEVADSKDFREQAHIEREVQEDALNEITNIGDTVLPVDVTITSEEEQIMQEEGQKGQVGSEQKILGSEDHEEFVVDMLGEGPSESHAMPVLHQGEEYARDTITEITKASEKVSDAGEPDQIDSSKPFNQVNEGETINIDEPAEVGKEHTAAEGLAGGSAIYGLQKDNHDHGEAGCELELESEVIEATTPVNLEVTCGKEPSPVNEKICPEDDAETRDSRSSLGGTDIAADSVSVSGGSEAVAHSCNNEDGETETHKKSEAGQAGSTADELSDNKINEWNIAAATAQHEDLDGANPTATHAKQAEEGNLSLPSSTASQASIESDLLSENDRRLIEENEKLKEMMEKLLECGSKQLNTISSLSGRIKDLEKRLSRKKKLRIRRHKTPPASGSSCLKPANNPLESGNLGLAV